MKGIGAILAITFLVVIVAAACTTRVYLDQRETDATDRSTAIDRPVVRERVITRERLK